MSDSRKLSPPPYRTVRWDHELEELVLEFGPADISPDEIDPLDTLFVHLDSIRKMTCPDTAI